jgi:hypothetical protein
MEAGYSPRNFTHQKMTRSHKPVDRNLNTNNSAVSNINKTILMECWVFYLVEAFEINSNLPSTIAVTTKATEIMYLTRLLIAKII